MSGETTIPETAVAKRDALGQLCFYHHIAMMVYILSGWSVPWRPALFFYLVFVPAVIGQWMLNKNTCVLNNIESVLRTGKWRNPRNREEGAWLHTLVVEATGVPITKTQLDWIMYSVMACLWGLGLLHLRGWRF
ncbi:MAG TPA: hypothetical protein VGG48_08115 [Rhizomicrobium sp.]|jgi:hypothetical protein